MKVWLPQFCHRKREAEKKLGMSVDVVHKTTWFAFNDLFDVAQNERNVFVLSSQNPESRKIKCSVY
jgi:hypothetical protein